MPINPVVLANKGAPFKLAAVNAKVLERTKDVINEETGLVEEQVVKTISYEVVTNPQLDDEVVVVEEWLRFTNGSLAALQGHYGSMDAFQAVSEARPNEAVAVSIAAMLGEDLSDPAALAKVNARVIPSEFPAYQVTIMALLSIANGVDPTKGARMIDEGLKTAKASIAEMNQVLDEAVEEMEAERLKAEAEAATEAPSDSTSSGSSSSGSASDDPTPSSGS